MRGKSLSSERRRRRRRALYEKSLTATYGTRGKEIVPPAGHRQCEVRGLEALGSRVPRVMIIITLYFGN